MSNGADTPQIQFYHAAPPPIPPGDYTVTVNQAVAVTDDTGKVINDAYGTTPNFTVAGPRFYLKPSEVYAVYPPAGQFGQFDDDLPHIVFTRRTLPWERTIDGNLQDSYAPVPWMALLLIGPGDCDPLPKVTARTVNDLLNPAPTMPGEKIAGPAISLEGGPKPSLEGGEDLADLCNTIDLPVALFASVVPTQADLPFLAHVRKVDLAGKETLSLQQDGYFTVVLSNRLPATAPQDQGAKSLACLVSLEGFAGLLPTVDPNGNATVSFDPSPTHVRLAVLASWNFTCWGTDDFKALLANLDYQSPLVLPQDKLTASDDGTTAVKNAFSLGYAGLNHTTRLGEKTVSWYRGPLVPMEINAPSTYSFLPCADSALRYDAANGLFATEYAAAFELGRLMALQNRTFASALYRYRRAWTQAETATTLRGLHENLLGVPAALQGQGTLEDAVAQLFAGSGGNASGGNGGNGRGGNGSTVPEYAPPQEVANFLARAVLLYGVPFHYLVPDEAMLPPESMRFFYLDPGWISTLLQGATSVGRNSPTETDFDSTIRQNALDQALGDSALIRQDPSGSEPTTTTANWPLTGFLLRSAMVEGWQGLEMHAYDGTILSALNQLQGEKTWRELVKSGFAVSHAEIAPLRIDRLAPDILLCIFNGVVAGITVKQPPEGLHFGLDNPVPAAPGQYVRFVSSLRKVTGAPGPTAPGEQFNPAATAATGSISVPMRNPVASGPSPTRVVRIADLVPLIQAQVHMLDSTTPPFTSAEFAVEMVESPGLAFFTISPSS